MRRAAPCRSSRPEENLSSMRPLHSILRRTFRAAAARVVQRLAGAVLWAAVVASAGMCANVRAAESPPLALHPDNGHYFLFRGKPTAIITSGEHYGAVINLDFDYKRYLDALAADGLNATRTFSGAYVEPPTAFNIARNTLAPREGRFLCPWARSDEPGYAGGGGKFDLNQWDDSYFKRLHDFVAYASQRGVVVEMNLFCPMYADDQWNISPMNPRNNLQGVGPQNREHVYTLDKHAGLLAVQERMVRRFVEELRDFDNLYYEICNEPYFGGVTDAWQRHMADVITEAERALPQAHLISQNIANGSAKIENPHPRVSIFNFHYATPPDAVAANFALGKVIGDNETGFKGTSDAVYRMEAWDFLLAGGGLFNNLDYSFVAGQEDGTFKYPDTQPGGGSPALRRQLGILSKFLRGFDLPKMRPDNSVVKGGVPEGVTARALVDPGRAYAIYLRRSPDAKQAAKPGPLVVALPTGAYHAEWINVLDGEIARSEKFDQSGGDKTLQPPPFVEDVALRVVCVD